MRANDATGVGSEPPVTGILAVPENECAGRRVSGRQDRESAQQCPARVPGDQVTIPALLLIGAGGHARACIDVIESHGGFRVGGLIGTPSEVGIDVLGYQVIGTDDDLPALSADFGHALVSVGQIKSATLRRSLFERLQQAGFRAPQITSQRATISRHAFIGAGTIVMHGAVIGAGVTVGNNCIINSMALVEHDSHVGDHCHVATSAVLNSGVVVGKESFIGSNSSVRQLVRIGENCVIGMGQTVLRDCPSGSWLPGAKGAT